MQIYQALFKIKWQQKWQGGGAAHLLRGAIAVKFPDNNLFHQHGVNGELIYRYPRLHYRWDGADGLVVAFGEGIDVLSQLLVPKLELKLGDKVLHIAENICEFRHPQIKIIDSLKEYYFRTPYLPLNQKNYLHYNSLSNEEKTDELARLARANILTSSRDLGVYFQKQVYAVIKVRKETWCTYKNKRFLGFLGTLITNVDLPQDFAIGKAVSHGYGWIKTKRG